MSIMKVIKSMNSSKLDWQIKNTYIWPAFTKALFMLLKHVWYTVIIITWEYE